MIKIKELIEKADISIKELKEGPVYLMLLDESLDADIESVKDVLSPVDVRVLLVPGPVTVRIFELEDSQPEKP